ncbi:gamma-aminobutyric acid receptor subunit pi-like [Pelobates fuscus]|uniref:gamma-aminobutyric acid receptor subunit pi-like n=1 Tax=Pelobates fuscus TaxID=191477 RepID=UPI002FE4436D
MYPYHREITALLSILFSIMHFSFVKSDGEILPPTIQKLMKGYNKYLRPFFDNGPVTVGMSLDIASIDTISEINMDYTATIFLRQRWTDERLCFEGNKSLSLDGRLVELLWVPDTFIVDSKKSFLHDITVENRLIRIYPNGTVLYALRITTTVACSMDLTKYPMDKQTCTLQLESWGYNINDVMFYWTRGNDSVRGLNTLRLAQYTVEDHYTSVSEAVYETGRYPKLIFHFDLKRNILYFILETYVPSILLVVLSWVSFWISQSSVPARICIGVTTVLTMTTLMMGARTSLPNANCFIKAIDVYLGICFSFIFGALLEYAIAHFCTLRLPNQKNSTQDMDDGDIDMNGSIVAVSSEANNQTQVTNREKKDNGRNNSAFLKAKKRLLCIFYCLRVENPHHIDNYSRLSFPLSFMVVNVLYWVYYLYF